MTIVEDFERIPLQFSGFWGSLKDFLGFYDSWKDFDWIPLQFFRILEPFLRIFCNFQVSGAIF